MKNYIPPILYCRNLKLLLRKYENAFYFVKMFSQTLRLNPFMTEADIIYRLVSI